MESFCSAFVILAFIGWSLTWYCNLQVPLMMDMFTKPSVMLDPHWGVHFFGVFLGDQGINSVTRAVAGTFVLTVGSIVIINCRATPDNTGKRLGFHYLALLVAMAFSFPLQCGLCTQPREPRADAVLAWVSTFLAGGVGMLVLLLPANDISINVWYFLLTTAVAVVYDRVATKAHERFMNSEHKPQIKTQSMAFQLLASINLTAS